MQAKIVPPADLFSPFRLDLPVKYMLFRSLACGTLGEVADRLYRRHILARTGGVEPPGFDGTHSAKSGVDHYVGAARDLLSSMRDNRYDPSFPATLGANDLPLEAAHRIACAAYLGCDVPVRKVDREGFGWDFKWFVEHRFPRNQLALILKEYALVTSDRTVVFILWGPALRFWDALTEAIGGTFQIAGQLDFAFALEEREAFRSLVYDVYAHDVGDFRGGMGHIDRKIGFLEEAPAFYRVIVASAPPSQRADVWSLARELKAQLRQSAASHVPVELFATCHAAESAPETRHLAHMLLDPFNLAAVRGRKSAKPRDTFLQWLSDYRAKLATLGIPPESACIVGSSSLEVAALRLSTDIDFTVRRDVRVALFAAHPQAVGNRLDVVMEGYHRRMDGANHSDDRLIDDPSLHFRFRGFKFASLAVIRDRKAASGRPKDLLDVELLDRMQPIQFLGAAVKDLY